MKKGLSVNPGKLLPFSPKTPVSVIIPVKNEERNIGPCLQHLQWADEIFVVDSQSADRTAAIAESLGAKIVQFHFSGSYPKKKNWALEHLPFRNPWVLIVDADERIPSDLAAEIHEAVTGRSGFDGYYINRRFFFLGRWIRHCGYSPSYNLRLFKHRLGRYEKILAQGAGDNEVHEHILLQGRAGYLRHDMLHFAYPDLSTWVEKHNRYSSWEAEAKDWYRRQGICGIGGISSKSLRAKRRLKWISQRLPLRFLFRFFYSYVLKGGIWDGKAGFILCLLLSFYDFLSWAKEYERMILPKVFIEFPSGKPGEEPQARRATRG